MRQLGVGEIVNMFATYGRTLGRGIGHMPVASSAPVAGMGDSIPDPTFYLGFSECPPGYQSDGAGSCNTVQPIGPPVPPGYVNPSIFCPPGQVASGGGTCFTPTSVYTAAGTPIPGSPAPASTPGGMSNTQKIVLGVSLGLLVLVLLPAMNR